MARTIPEFDFIRKEHFDARLNLYISAKKRSILNFNRNQTIREEVN